MFGHPKNQVFYLRLGPDNSLYETFDDTVDEARVLWYFGRSLSDDQRMKVQHIAIDVNEEWETLQAVQDFSQQISQFSELKTLVIVLGAREFHEHLSERMLVHHAQPKKWECDLMLAEIRSLLYATKTQYPRWKEANVEVVYWEGHHNRCECGCDSRKKLTLL
jgi:hypothetical protein